MKHRLTRLISAVFAVGAIIGIGVIIVVVFLVKATTRGALASSHSQLMGNEKKSLQSIQSVDFRNFTFPALPSGKCVSNQIKLTDGKYEAPPSVRRDIPSTDCWTLTLGSVVYGDVTGDHVDEAIVTLYAELGGTDSSEDVFIFGKRETQLVLLWKFVTGDRAHGGLRRLSAEKGQLMIELFGIHKVIGKDMDETEEEGPACCPKFFTRVRYAWIDGRFQPVGSEEVHPVTEENPYGPIAPSPHP